MGADREKGRVVAALAIAVSMSSTLALRTISTPMSAMRLTSASSTSRGRRYFGMPKRIMPPASGPASRIVTVWP